MKTRMETNSLGFSLQLPKQLEDFIKQILVPRDSTNPNFILLTNDGREILLDVRKALLIGDLEGIPTISRVDLKKFAAGLIDAREKLTEPNYVAVSRVAGSQESTDIAFA